MITRRTHTAVVDFPRLQCTREHAQSERACLLIHLPQHGALLKEQWFLGIHYDVVKVRLPTSTLL